MKLIQSIFITSFITLISSVGVYAAIEIFRGHQPWLSWLGLLLAAAAPTFFFAKAFLLPTARTARHPVGVSALCGLGVAITMVSSWRFGAAAEQALPWSGLCLLGWFIYLRWYSEFPGRHSPALEPGRELPDIMLENLNGETVKSSELLGKIHILIFYRGNWCPFCTAHRHYHRCNRPYCLGS